MSIHAKWFVVASAAVIAIGAMVAVNFLLTSGPAPLMTTKAFYDAAERGDYQEAYAQFHSDLQAAQSFQEFGALARDLEVFGHATYRRWSTEVKDGVATVEGAITVENDVQVSAVFRLVEENGNWKIITYTVQSGQSSVISSPSS
ncbi:MAG: hypothetical protein Q7K03_00785 [Dehalococcoidia bacterium]|nr:hypothetical protein [Dehalococcoidia bacterium]